MNNSILLTIINELENIICNENVFQKTMESIRHELELKFHMDLYDLRYYISDQILVMVKQHYESTLFPYPFIETTDFTPDCDEILYMVSPDLRSIIKKKEVYFKELVPLICKYASTNNLIKDGLIYSDQMLQKLSNSLIFNPSTYDFKKHLHQIPIESTDIMALDETPGTYNQESLEKYSRVKLYKCAPDLAVYLCVNFTTFKAAVTKIKYDIKLNNMKSSRGTIECNPPLRQLLGCESTTISNINKTIRSKLTKALKYQIPPRDQEKSAKFLMYLEHKQAGLSSAQTLKRRQSKFVDMKFVKPNEVFSRICQVEYFPRQVGLKFLWSYIRSKVPPVVLFGKRTYTADDYLIQLGFPERFQAQAVMSILSTLVTDVDKLKIDSSSLHKSSSFLEMLDEAKILSNAPSPEHQNTFTSSQEAFP